MPNWSSTQITVSGKKEDILDFLDKIGTKKSAIDFNKIIPEPQTIEEYKKWGIEETPEEAHIQLDEKRPWFNWYKWRLIAYGVKWPQSEVSINRDKLDVAKEDEYTSCTICFETPWSPPFPILKTICERMSDKLNLTIKMAEEQGIYGGIMRTHRGMVLEDEWYERCDKAYDISEDVIGYSLRSLENEEYEQVGEA